jgi:type VI secretion system protein ImpM
MIPSAWAQKSFPAGWYGKIPAAGDFVTRRLASSFTGAWDRWLQAVLAGSRGRLGEGWRDSFLSMPIWRFVMSPGMLTEEAWACMVAPSVDGVGRCFPLAVASALPSASLDVVGTLFAAAPWFDAVEDILLDAITPGADAAAIDAAVSRTPFLSEWLRYPGSADDTVPMRGQKPQMLWLPLEPRDPQPPRLQPSELAERLSEPRAAWLAEESELFGRCLLLCEAMPAAEQYCAMMNGRWIEQGWGPRDLRTSAAA